MSSHDENGYTSTGAIARHSRRLSRQDILNEKRHRTTDVLPTIASDAPDGKLGTRQMTQLRDENRRLRRELEELQRRVVQHREAEAQLEKEIETVHTGHQLEIEQYQSHLLSPEHTPAILHDVMKTLEFQVKQTEDQHVAEIMALMRQVQRKNEQLEHELAQERDKI